MNRICIRLQEISDSGAAQFSAVASPKPDTRSGIRALFVKHIFVQKLEAVCNYSFAETPCIRKCLYWSRCVFKETCMFAS